MGELRMGELRMGELRMGGLRMGESSALAIAKQSSLV